MRSPAAARRIGLHQYGPRVGVLVDAFRIELRAKHEDSTIAVAPPRGHKTAAVVIPRVLDAPGAVVTTSTKADVLLATCTRRALLGTVWVFDAEGIAQPFAPSWQPLSWDPLEGCRDPDVAIRRAAALVGARPMGGVRNGDFFSSSASGVLRCWLLAAAAGGHPVTELNRWLHNLHDTTPAEILDVHLPGWAADLRGLAANPGGEMVGGVLGTLQLVLSPLASPSIAAACTGSGRFRISEFLTSTDTLYLMTEGNADGAGPFVTALVDEIMHQARRASQLREGERLDPPLAMVLDEPANTAAMPHMPTYMSDCRRPRDHPDAGPAGLVADATTLGDRRGQGDLELRDPGPGDGRQQGNPVPGGHLAPRRGVRPGQGRPPPGAAVPGPGSTPSRPNGSSRSAICGRSPTGGP